MSGLEKRLRRKGIVAMARESRRTSTTSASLGMFIAIWLERLHGR